MKSVIEVKQGVAICVREDKQFFFGQNTKMKRGDNYEKKLFYF